MGERFYSLMFGKKHNDDLGQQLVEHLPSIWRFALALSGDPDIADDLVQATCLRAIEKQSQFDGLGSLIGWCLTICRSIWLNELRKNAKRQTSALDAVEPEKLIDHKIDIELNIFAAQVFTKVMELPEAQRAVVELVYVEGFKYSEAAKILDIPIGTIMSRLSAARKKLSELGGSKTLVGQV